MLKLYRMRAVTGVFICEQEVWIMLWAGAAGRAQAHCGCWALGRADGVLDACCEHIATPVNPGT